MTIGAREPLVTVPLPPVFPRTFEADCNRLDNPNVIVPGQVPANPVRCRHHVPLGR